MPRESSNPVTRGRAALSTTVEGRRRASCSFTAEQRGFTEEMHLLSFRNANGEQGPLN